jgi:hypothetical protein
MVFLVYGAGCAAVIAGCPKSTPPMDEAGAPPDSSIGAPPVTELSPLVDDAGDDADAAEAVAPKKPAVRAGYTANQVKIRECCSAMRKQAKQWGESSPEGFQLMTLAAQCDTVAEQLGPHGTAPELSQMRELLKSLRLPAACQF